MELSVILPSFGFVGNVTFMLYLLRHRVGTRISFILLRMQTTIDACICLCSMAEILQSKFWETGLPTVDKFLCYMWHSQFIYWYLINSSIYTVILAVVDRFMFVVLPFQYKKHKLWHLFLALFVVYFLGIPHIGAMIVEAGYIDGNSTCEPTFDYYVSLYPNFKYFRLVFSVNWFLLDFLCPGLIILVLYSFVIRALRQSKKQTTSNKSSLSTRFTLATMIIAIIMFVSISYDATFYLLLTYDFIEVDYFNPAYNKIGVVLSALNSSVNPYIYILLMPPFRRFTFKLITCRKCRTEEKSASGSMSEKTISLKKVSVLFRKPIYALPGKSKLYKMDTYSQSFDDGNTIPVRWQPTNGEVNHAFEHHD